MTYKTMYHSPLGNMLLVADDTGLTHLDFANTVKPRPGDAEAIPAPDHPVLQQATHWLDLYFAGEEPDFLPPLHLQGTPFQESVWHLLLGIPYGKTTTYGTLAREIARQRVRNHMSAQAVGNAVGSNPISVIVPCHRVIGSDGNLTGYSGGLPRKDYMLKLERGVRK
jgi:methylated-DNA-[protein]-cysteine S-methyltransferase